MQCWQVDPTTLHVACMRTTDVDLHQAGIEKHQRMLLLLLLACSGFIVGSVLELGLQELGILQLLAYCGSLYRLLCRLEVTQALHLNGESLKLTQ